MAATTESVQAQADVAGNEAPVLYEGLIEGLPNHVYHADKNSYSVSLIKQMKVPAEAKHYMDNPPEHKECFRVGSAIHSYILEPGSFGMTYLIGLDRPRRSNADKAAWDEWFVEHGGEVGTVDRPAAEWFPKFEQDSGRHIVTPDELTMLKAMGESIKSNPEARELLEAGRPEVSLFWTDPGTGLRLRCRPDFMNDFASDLKSIQGVRDHEIARTVGQFGYAIQQVHYLHGIQAVTGEVVPFPFIFISKTAPYLCRVIALGDETVAAAYRQWRDYMNKLDQCLQRDEWPGIPNNYAFEIPDYYFNEE